MFDLTDIYPGVVDGVLTHSDTRPDYVALALMFMSILLGQLVGKGGK